MRLTKTLAGVATIASAAFALSAMSAQAAPQVTYTLNASPTVFLVINSGFITTDMTVPTNFCLGACSDVTFDPADVSAGEMTDEVSVGGSNFFFAPGTFAGPVLGTTALAGSSSTGTFSTLAISSAPEPATWALMILGVGMLGGALRYSRGRGWASAAA